MESLKHYCGVFGCLATDDWPTQYDVAQLIHLGLVSLQHRGQECGGIATSKGSINSIIVHKARGLISHSFSNENIISLRGNLGIGHTRYSTQAGSDMINCQPFVVHASCGQIAIAHNGELLNANKLRKKIQARGVGLSTSSDSELIAQMLSIPADTENNISEPDWENRIINFMQECAISYSLLLMYKDEIWGIRDPYGNRPLCIGKFKTSEIEIAQKAGVWLISSESCAFGSMGAKIYKEILPGEIVKITKEGVQSINVVLPPKLPNYVQTPASCLFEYIYFARSDSIFEGQQLYSVRLKCGRQLAKESPVIGADLVSTVPDSATPAALGFAQESGVPYLEVLTKNPYVGRTFIQPSPHLRKLGVAKKFGVLSDNLKNKKIVLVDDSIVRGTTMQPIIKLLKEHGAKEVHVRVSSPPVKYPCFMGINIPTRQELIANKYEANEMAHVFGADSVAYLSLEGLKLSITSGLHKNGVSRTSGYCSACFTGEYPVPLEW